ncbi:MAG: EF-P lysine aminoacylase GenX [Planctomycetales bacterium]|nr:EF-P lysine aminoacylase GenX [Planctomycetales bacterium]
MTILERRSELLAAARQFFWQRNFVEVETPLLSSEVIPELHIEPLAAKAHNEDQESWLQASPELHMKRVLAGGAKAVFQITRSFRGGERGALHHPEFTIVEWYRVGDDDQAGIQLLDQFCQSLLGTAPATLTSYGEAFQKRVAICPHTSTAEELAACARKFQLVIPDGFPKHDRDEWLNLLLTTLIEPNLGRELPVILYDYPATQAALAKTSTRKDGIEVARRFELYWRGVELANGYDELTDAEKLRSRLERVNQQRSADGRAALPLPTSLLDAMRSSLPACSGCALGFDRLVMLATGAKSIAEVMACPEA